MWTNGAGARSGAPSFSRRRSLFLAAGIVAISSAAAAETPTAGSASPTAVGEIVVTGSHIAGTPKDGPAPVQVLTQQELRDQGSPSNVDLIKALPIVGATIAGDANPLNASRVEGAASVNLRGLGNARTLVLFNGHRLATLSSGAQSLLVDLNTLPMAATARVEVLKDGGASVYGSDAIAGVVNILTTKTLQGFDVGANYSAISGEDGDFNGHVNWGWVGDRGNILLSAGYTHRSQLKATDRSATYRDYLDNPTGWTTQSNPGQYQIGNTGLAADNSTFMDPGCAGLGGLVTPNATAVGTAHNCLFHYIGFQNIVDEQRMYQLYGELNFNITDHSQFHLEAFYSNTNVPDVATAPSSALLSGSPPTSLSTGPQTTGSGIIAGRYYIPANNPGLRDLFGSCSASILTSLNLTAGQCADALIKGVNTTSNWRPMLAGGNPLFNNGSKLDHRIYNVYHVTGGFSGDVMGINWEANLTFGQTEADSSAIDIQSSRLEYALRGFGGAGCDPTTGVAGVGPCQYFNPFSTGVAANAVTGAPNPGFVGHTNSAALIAWMADPDNPVVTNRVAVGEFNLNGGLPFHLPGGQVKWAAGAQYRYASQKVETDPTSNFLINPCVDAGAPLSSCSQSAAGLGMVFAAVTPSFYATHAAALYGELRLPIMDSLEGEAALRYERFPTGSTLNPKISLRWQATQFLALRASYESTFRNPQLGSTDPGNNSTVGQLVGVTRIPFVQNGNPHLGPEESKNIDVGVIFHMTHLRATFDYWRYDLKNQIQLEPGPLLTSLFLADVAHCTDPAFATLLARYTFDAAGCAGAAANPSTGAAANPAHVLRMQTYFINGPEIVTDGLDLSMDAPFNDAIWGGDLDIGADVTYNLRFKVAALNEFGFKNIVPGFDAVGNLNASVGFNAMPRWRGDFFVSYVKGPHSLRWVTHYIDGMHDQRDQLAVGAITAQVAGYPTGTIVTNGVNIAPFLTHDLYYRVNLPWSTTLNLSLINMFNTMPPIARTDLSYDAFTANALGRVFKVGFTKTF
jgi:iron complex outermembrane receptor protein